MAPQARYPGVEFSQFFGAEAIAKKYELSKDQLDDYAFQSHQRAMAAVRAQAFDDEILALPVRMQDGAESGELHREDEGIRFDASLEGIRIAKLIQPGARVRAATASQICDGARGVMVANEHGLKALGIHPWRGCTT